MLFMAWRWDAYCYQSDTFLVKGLHHGGGAQNSTTPDPLKRCRVIKTLFIWWYINLSCFYHFTSNYLIYPQRYKKKMFYPILCPSLTDTTGLEVHGKTLIIYDSPWSTHNVKHVCLTWRLCFMSAQCSATAVPVGFFFVVVVKKVWE